MQIMRQGRLRYHWYKGMNPRSYDRLERLLLSENCLTVAGQEHIHFWKSKRREAFSPEEVQMRARLADIEAITCTNAFMTSPPYKQCMLYHEALTLCESLGLDNEWIRYKAYLEDAQREQLKVRTQAMKRGEDF